MTAAQTVLQFVPETPDTNTLDRLASIMYELAQERGPLGVTVARTIHVAKARGIDVGPAGTGKESRKGSWRGGLGRRAKLVASSRVERVDPEWFPESHFNRQTVWLHPRYAEGAA
jgi:hypothetical protein